MNTKYLAATIVFIFITSSCDEEIFYPSYPPNFVEGARIEFTVEDPGTARIPIGFVIVYEFPLNRNDPPYGINPTSGQRYTPDKYKFRGTSEEDPPGARYAIIRLEYSGGLAWEEYTLTPNDNGVEQGHYSYKADTGSGELWAKGRYSVLSHSTINPGGGLYDWPLACPSGAQSVIKIPSGACEAEYKNFAAAFGCNEIADYYDTCISLYSCLLNDGQSQYQEQLENCSIYQMN